MSDLRNSIIVTLRDGRSVIIRPVGMQDGEAIQCFMDSLSSSSRYQRFLGALVQMPTELLQRLLLAPSRHEVALIAQTYGEAGPSIVGLAQLANEQRDYCGEVGVVVAEDWRRVGLATQLLRRLSVHALRLGFQ